jgi:hypothetical protein
MFQFPIPYRVQRLKNEILLVVISAGRHTIYAAYGENVVSSLKGKKKV